MTYSELVDALVELAYRAEDDSYLNAKVHVDLSGSLRSDEVGSIEYKEGTCFPPFIMINLE